MAYKNIDELGLISQSGVGDLNDQTLPTGIYYTSLSTANQPEQKHFVLVNLNWNKGGNEIIQYLLASGYDAETNYKRRYTGRGWPNFEPM